MQQKLSSSPGSIGLFPDLLGQDQSPEIYIGTHGWSGVELNWMYQKGLSPLGKLGVYSQMFNAVEVDQTFYGLECLGAYKGWLDAVPEGFLFSLKIPQSITHQKWLRDPEPELTEFLKAARKFDDHLGPVLVQLSPSFDISNAENLRTFLDRLPFNEMRFAVEVRDRLLWAEIVPCLMEQYPFIPVTTNLIASPASLRALDGTAYVRWLGPRFRFEGPLRTPEQFDLETIAWAESIQRMVESSDSAKVFVFVDHEYFGPGVIGAARLRKLMGDPVHFPGALF